MAVNLSPRGPTRPIGSSGSRDRQRDDRQHQAGAGEEHDVHRPAADGEKTDPAQGQQQPQRRSTHEREPHHDQTLAPVLEGDHEQPDAHRDEHGHQRQLPDEPGEEGPADVERRRGHRSHADRASSAAACSAAATTLASSIARVIGPTPPGLGATWPATFRTSRATSPAIAPSTRLTPTSRTAAPGMTTSTVMTPGTPAAATTTSARRTCAARS